MQYFAAAARAEAYRSVLAGPETLFPELASRLPNVRELAGRFPDGRPIRDRAALPVVHPGGPPLQSHRRNYPPRRETLRWLVKNFARHYLVPASSRDELAPQIHLAYSDARWWVVPAYDSLLVSNAEGSAVVWQRRDRATFRAGLWRSVRFRQRLRAQWPELSRRYRDSLVDLTSVESWRRVFTGTE
jgi:galactofuranosylgalactofuranosylrhamnosyl-N-acetylglucosaminyl-diphospho-decaprenol beta-1,5/1,6-galactofuranosyltransferase